VGRLLRGKDAFAIVLAMYQRIAADVLSSPVLLHQIGSKRPKTRKPVARIDIVLDDVKGKIVKSAEAPDGDSKQGANPERRMFQDKQRCRENSNEEEKDAFELNPVWIREVFHGWPQPSAEQQGVKFKFQLGHGRVLELAAMSVM
jgi:hypothetical protein